MTLPRSIAGWVSWTCLWPLRCVASTGDPHATADRLFVSQHVRDLRLIAGFALLLFYISVITVPLYVLIDPPAPAGPGHHLHQAALFWALASKTFAFLGPAAAVVVTVLTWAYQTGSARLGVVDLFACEISTLCRVTLVVDTVKRRIDEFAAGPGAPAETPNKPPEGVHPFTSQESYFPVFESNSSGLQTLEADVVINITAFYTYMKAVRDYLRALSAIAPHPSDLVSPSTAAPVGSWREAARNVLYMLFLGLESGRMAVGQLVEFEPEEGERTTVILISELQAYCFLCSQYMDPADIHYQRIRLRERDYEAAVPTLIKTLARFEKSKDVIARTEWEPAWRLLPKLEETYAGVKSSLAAHPKGAFEIALNPAAGPLARALHALAGGLALPHRQRPAH